MKTEKENNVRKIIQIIIYIEALSSKFKDLGKTRK